MDFQLTSGAFENNGTMPARYTCRGENVSPPLSWTDPPDGTAELALVVVDLDTPFGTITHWIVYGIPPDRRELSEAVDAVTLSDAGISQGRNGAFRRHYMGPCPPWGRHRYVFTIYALDASPSFRRIPSRKSLLRMIRPNIIASSTLTGLFARGDGGE